MLLRLAAGRAALLRAPLLSRGSALRALSSRPGEAGTTASPPRAELSSGNYLWGITDEQIATLGESVRRAVSLENASSSDRMKVELHRAIQHWQARPGDTGSPAVQIATLTVRIEYLSRHLVVHHKDKGSKRSMSLLIGQRNRMLKYLLREDREMYRRVCTELKVGPYKKLQNTLTDGRATAP